jgi:hypothetical protein
MADQGNDTRRSEDQGIEAGADDPSGLLLAVEDLESASDRDHDQLTSDFASPAR